MARSEPHRRPLRHTYQEGPDFLFLATRGGRPPGATRREDLAALRFRIRCVHTAEERGIAAALALGTSRASLHRWRRAHAEGGIEALRQQPRGPARTCLPTWLWHIDIKGPFWLRRSEHERTKVWIVGLVDDHSRFLIGLRVLPQPSTAPILAWFEECLELVGIPLKVISDNGAPSATGMQGVLTLFGRTRGQLHIRHIRTQVNSPWTNGKIERFWGVLRAELLDRELFTTLEAADAGLIRFAVYYDDHRPNGAIGWQTPAERWDGTPFTDQGFEHVPALEHLQGWLTELMAA